MEIYIYSFENIHTADFHSFFSPCRNQTKLADGSICTFSNFSGELVFGAPLMKGNFDSQRKSLRVPTLSNSDRKAHIIKAPITLAISLPLLTRSELMREQLSTRCTE